MKEVFSHLMAMAIAFAEISNLKWQLRLRKFQNGNCVCGNLKSQMAIAFAKISNLNWQLRLRKSQISIGNCVCGNLKW